MDFWGEWSRSPGIFMFFFPLFWGASNSGWTTPLFSVVLLTSSLQVNRPRNPRWALGNPACPTVHRSSPPMEWSSFGRRDLICWHSRTHGVEGGWGFAGKAGWEGVFLCVFWGMAEGVFFKEQKSSSMATCGIRTMDHVSFGLIHGGSNLGGIPPTKKRQLQETRTNGFYKSKKGIERLFISILVGGSSNIFFSKFHPKPWGFMIFNLRSLFFKGVVNPTTN